ncbi:MAG: GTPase ObgE [Lentisphaeria bacterium]|nr:GTPase ObgE [Lentisphaeria bacterium]
MFVDKAQITIKAGDGGNGCCSFRREAFIPKGGPDGGDGATGGNVVFVAAPGEQSLQDFLFNRRFAAKNGGNGKGKDMHGRNGADVIIKVPPGTIIRRVDTDEVLADIDTIDKQVVVLRGGKGGRGNARFATSVNRAPREHEPGEKTEPVLVELELKLIADVGLVGFPNAGKSTLLSALSNAKPKIAPYPFTTRHPVIGTVEMPEFKSFLMADVPGLLDGAHRNVGLGHEFLRHIERTKILLYVLDMAGIDGRNPVDDLTVLQNELELYLKGLSSRAVYVIANKMDLEESQENLKVLKRKFGRKIKILPISAATDESFDKLKKTIWEALLEARENENKKDYEKYAR